MTDEQARLDAIDAHLAECGLRIKTHGARWSLALAAALLHGMRAGHDSGWQVHLDGHGHTQMQCPSPSCSRHVGVGVERIRRQG